MTWRAEKKEDANRRTPVLRMDLHVGQQVVADAADMRTEKLQRLGLVARFTQLDELDVLLVCALAILLRES